jgi:type I restriction enzyme R subunit
VATSREAAVRYKGYVRRRAAWTVAALEQSNPQMLDVERLRRLKTDVVISGSHNDEPTSEALHGFEAKHKATIKSFKLPFDSEDEGVNGDMGIVIVNNMLLTGFDAPVEQVMYLDKIIVAHTAPTGNCPREPSGGAVEGERALLSIMSASATT